MMEATVATPFNPGNPSASKADLPVYESSPTRVHVTFTCLLVAAPGILAQPSFPEIASMTDAAGHGRWHSRCTVSHSITFTPTTGFTQHLS